MLSIGDFSCMTKLSVKALRHYHDVGLVVRHRINLAYTQPGDYATRRGTSSASRLRCVRWPVFRSDREGANR